MARLFQAPELFHPEHALGALQLAYENLAGPLGMRTLDPNDWAYQPNYDNSNDSEDKAIAKGWNYHQGPEWVWCMGYFLRAYLHFDVEVNCGSEKASLKVSLLSNCVLAKSSIFNPLLVCSTSPMQCFTFITSFLHTRKRSRETAGRASELTNKDGAVCWDSCPTQAWSASALLDLLDDMVRRWEDRRDCVGELAGLGKKITVI